NRKGCQHTGHGSHKRNRAQTVNPAPGVYICIRYRFIGFSHFFYPPMDILSLFTEVGKSQSCRGLVFLLLTEAGDYQNDDGNYIRQRLENFLHASSQSGDVKIQDVESAEKESSPYSVQRFPQSEDYKGNRKPSSVAEAVIRPGSAGVLHNEVQAAQTRKTCADAGGKIFILRNVDSRRVRGRRAFS